ncbi:hypothetical protein LEP1GSC131_2868 [Leptospira kirschneri str. 200802841]|uniref:Uncharacterized protein n=1 Tax=Leptospira kirschneri str. 200802841 TaxID=1193047 RepID=A0A828XSQ9_9LEPT|nr:hypothetical protein LEP1GSC131_2868 [Leptospira kirschneri str. 200802841]
MVPFSFPGGRRMNLPLNCLARIPTSFKPKDSDLSKSRSQNYLSKKLKAMIELAR